MAKGEMTSTETLRVVRIRGIGAMTEGALHVFLILSFLLVVALVFAAVSWDTARRAQARLDAREVAENVGKVSQCASSIEAFRVANIVIESTRQAHRSTAENAERLAEVDPTAKLKATHLKIANRERAKADALTDLAAVTQKQCNKLADKLNVPRPNPIKPARKG